MKTFSPNAITALGAEQHWDGGRVRWASFDDGYTCGFVDDGSIIEANRVELNQEVYDLKTFYLRIALAEWHKSLNGVVQAGLEGFKQRIQGLFNLAYRHGSSNERYGECVDGAHKMGCRLTEGCDAVRSAGDCETPQERDNLHKKLVAIVLGDYIDCGFRRDSAEFMILRELQIDIITALVFMPCEVAPDGEED